jgi:hypothetical protein
MPRILPALALCVIFLPVEAALLPFLGAGLGGLGPALHADLALCAVVWLAVGPAGTVEGAVGAYACGTIADLLYSVQPGLFAFLAVLLYLLGRFGSAALDVRGAGGFAVLCGLGSLVQAGLAFLLLTFLGQPWPSGAWPAVFGGALVTALVAPPSFRLLGWATEILETEDPSLLR